MIRFIPATLAVVAALALGACGSSEEPAASKVTPEAAKARVERAAHVKLKADPVPSEARKQGLRATYSNTATVVRDKQAVALFVMKDADTAGEVTKRVRGTAPKSARLIAHGPILVVYAAAGADRADAVEQAVESL